MGAVAVRNYEPVSTANHADNRPRGAPRIGQLLDDGSLLTRANQGVATDGNEHRLHS